MFILQITAYVTLTEAFSDPWCKATALALNIYPVFYHTVWLPWWLSGKESACKAGAAGDTGSITGVRRSLGGEHGNLLQYSCLENPMDRGAWQAAVHGVAKSWTWLKWLSTWQNRLNKRRKRERAGGSGAQRVGGGIWWSEVIPCSSQPLPSFHLLGRFGDWHHAAGQKMRAIRGLSFPCLILDA